MKTFAFLSALFTLSLSAQAAVAPASIQAEIKREVELKVNLTKEGYRNLETQFLKDFKGERTKRSDYYFEIFDDGQYLLKKSEPVIKLRFMWDGLDLKWQTQQTEKSWAYSIFTFKETLAESSIIKAPHLLKDIEHYHELLEKLESKALDEAHDIQKELEDKGIIASLPTLCSLCTGEKQFFSSHMNQKVRTKIKLIVDGDQFTLQVGETANNGVTTYELEAEVKKSTDLKLSAERLQKWLTKKGFVSAHIETQESIDPARKSEALLQKLIY